MLLLKFRRIVFTAVGLEFLVLGVALHLGVRGSVFLLLFVWLGVVSSCFMLALLVGLVKSSGSEFCYFS